MYYITVLKEFESKLATITLTNSKMYYISIL
jgi:hypothetical protein